MAGGRGARRDEDCRGLPCGECRDDRYSGDVELGLCVCCGRCLLSKSKSKLSASIFSQCRKEDTHANIAKQRPVHCQL